ncbi:MAG TPA: SDR family oxidoreductase [Sphingobium sp.]|uniref:SDR family NAD(P)-dependent oxidoreductase n=1 Tax=Sphingobium sp. TaxID=1912891 RepID=UPI002ED20457
MSAPDAPFAGGVALIYGAAKGIGRAAALEFARRGARVAIADLDQRAADQTAAEIRSAGGDSIGLACDVLSDASVAQVAGQATGQLGEPTIVMNNVGGIISGNPEDIPISEWERLMSLNFFSVVRSNAVFLPRMIARGSGHIVNTASFAGLYPYAANRMPYVAAKAAVIALSESLALYLRPQGVQVSCLCPGPVATGVADGMKSWTPELPMRGPGANLRVKTSEEVAIILADGIGEGRLIIPSHDEVWEVLQDHASSPDAFIDRAVERYAQGDTGMPFVDPAMLAAFAVQQEKAES